MKGINIKFIPKLQNHFFKISFVWYIDDILVADFNI